jgi:hydroxymethylpyrimidine pyrophosphatase-like HAD family hydrolase
VSAPVSLVVTDLDGTLWDRTTRIHPSTRDALDRLEQAGIPVLVATARRAATVRLLLSQNDLVLPAVLLDGALGRDLRTGETFHRRTFPTDDGVAILDAFATAGVEPCVNVVSPDDVDAVIGPNPSSDAEYLAFIGPWSRRGELADVVASGDVLSFTVYGVPLEVVEPVAGAVSAWGVATVAHDHQFGGHGISVRTFGIDKWQGVDAFCRDRGIDDGAVLAIGDGDNDLEMLDHAHVACAIAGGSPNALALADHVIGPPEVGGWAGILDLVGL